ncbi:BnaC04g21850D [Brassica napus]|uniref:BnaC04g21850D protein n=1 Tax=Brassica napus TaxID=3708 RepID=A0A078HXP5_BRANA|nr:BnaC04g21850D [Brassica napus]
MELTALADIKPFKSEWRIQVKVLHTWKHYTKLSGETLEIIMSDAHGTKILASCKKTYFEKFAKKVLVGTWRNIENFSINGPSVSYRPTNHQYKINFIYGTDITPSTLQNDNMFLSLVDFQTIQQGVEDENILIDVIGEVTDLGPLDTVLCYGKKIKKIEFSLTDLQGRRIACCLWGKFAESIQANCKAVGGDIVICLLCFVKIGTHKIVCLFMSDEVQISNSYDASQIFFNLPIMETEAFLKRDVASNALTLVESEQDKLEREIRRDKWMQYPIRDIAELLSSTQIEQCRIIATIYAIDKDWGWYYFGCKACNKKVNKISTKVQIVKGNEITTHLWWCEKCDDKVTKVLPKFRIHVWVKDGTGEAYLMLLDWIAIGVIPETAAALLNGSFEEAITYIESFPEAITDLVGKTFMFGIYIESNNVASKGGMYKVGKVWKDLSMLLTGGSTTESWTQSDVGTTNLSGSQANEDTVVTPSSKRKQQSNEGEPDISSTTKKQCARVFVKKEKTTKEDSSSKKSG